MNNKRFFSFILTICIVMSLFAGFAQIASADGNVITHTVQNGEYLFKICKAYGLDYYQCKNAIMALNGFTSEQQLNRITVGQQIKLPANNALASSVSASTTTTTTVSTSTTIGGTTTTTSTTTTTAGTPAAASADSVFFLVPYMVKSGDTLNNICNALGTSYFTYSNMILAMNGIANAGSLQVGKTIYVPVNALPQTGGAYYKVVYHTVKNGENMSSIAGSYGMNYASNSKLINGLNSGKNLNKLLVGEGVYVPVAGTATPASSAATTTSTSSASSTGTGAASTTVPTYEINMGETTGYNGYPYATVNGKNVSRAAAGSTVTINGNADNGYAVEKITVVRLDSLATIPTSGNSFTMPASAVKVSVQYKAGFKLTKAPAANGTFDVYVNGAIADHALAGDKITIVANPNYTYVASSVTATDSTVKKDSVNNYSFTMPAKNVTVTVTFAQAAMYTITTNKSRTYDSIQYGTVQYTVGGTPADKVAEGAVVTMNFTLPKGVIVKTLTVKKGTENIPFTRVEGQPKWYFTMPAGDVTVNVLYAGSTTYNINTVIVSDDGKGTGNVSYQVDGAGKNTAVAGQTVRVVVNPTGTSQFVNILVRYTDGTTNVVTTIDGSNMYVFTMPQSSVNVYVHFIAGTQKFSVYNLGSVVLAYKNSSGQQTTSYDAGEKCIVIPQYDHDSYKITGVYWRDQSGVDHPIAENPVGSGEYPFNMPNPGYNVGVYAKAEYFETWAIINLSESTGVSLYLYDNKGNPMVSGTHVKSGSTITVQAIVDSGYALDSITKTGGVNPMNGSGTTYTYTVSSKDNGSTITFTSTSHAE